MQYRSRVTSNGCLVLTRSSRRYAISFAFLVMGGFFASVGAASVNGEFIVKGMPALLPFALAFLSASASLLTLMNAGAPRRMVLDGDGLRMTMNRRKFRIGKEDIRGAWARKTVSFGYREGRKRSAILWKAFIALKAGSIIPLYEGPSRGKAEALSAACAAALDSGASARDALVGKGEGTAKPDGPEAGMPFTLSRGSEGAVLDVPIRLDVSAFLLSTGMLSGTGIILFGILPGRADAVILTLLYVIWGIFALVFVAAFGFGLFGRQRLVIGEREIEARRGIFGIAFPPARLERAEAAATYLDLEDNSLSIVSRGLKRELEEKLGIQRERPDQDPDVEAAADTMAVFLSGRIVRLDVSALGWIDRFILERVVAGLLKEKEP